MSAGIEAEVGVKIAVAYFRNKLDNTPRQSECSWERLSRVLTEHREREQKDGPLWSPTLYKRNSTRAKANVEAVSCLVLDFDRGQAPEEFTEGWGRWSYVMHTTFQHTPEAPRWRVVFPLKKPVAAEDWPRVWSALAQRFGGSSIDQSCKDASRIYYLPAVPLGGVCLSHENQGEWLDVEEFLRPTVDYLVQRAKNELHTGRNNAGMWLAVQMRDNGYTQGETEDARWHLEVPQEKTDPNGRFDPYTEQEWLDTVRKVFGRSRREAWVPSTNGMNGTAHREKEDPSDASVVSVKPLATCEELLPPAKLEPEALHGLPGEVVRTIEPHTESAPAAILASFLIGAGCLLGRGPFVYRDGARHFPNEFAVLVGLTAKGRKGTASRRVDEVFKSLGINSDNNNSNTSLHVMKGDYTDLILSGLGSGEALIEALADEDEDRRRLVFEEEFSKPLKVMRRDGSTLSENLRSAWDGGILANRTKGRRLIAIGAHVCILGHITEQELRLQLGAVDVFNGFANRFLWFLVSRSKSLPFGGGEAPIAPIVLQLQETLQFARTIHQMEFDDEVKALWSEGGIYDLLITRPRGLLGAVTSRAEAHVTRLAMLYSVLDCERVIRLPHLLAALAVWDYSEKSCAYIFGTSSGDEYADTIEELLTEVYPGFLTRKEIRDHYSRNAQPGRISKALALLKKEGRAEMIQVPTPGRHAEAWQLKSAYGVDLNDKNDRSPLEVARALTRETNR